jgi:hypothetical protein
MTEQRWGMATGDLEQLLVKSHEQFATLNALPNPSAFPS